MRENRKFQFLWKPGHSCFESHQSSTKGPGPVSCLDLFSPNFMDCTKAMAPGDRACGIRWIHQSDACPIRKVHSLASSRAVATLTICWCYRSLLLRNAILARLLWTPPQISLHILRISIFWIDMQIWWFSPTANLAKWCEFEHNYLTNYEDWQRPASN